MRPTEQELALFRAVAEGMGDAEIAQLPGFTDQIHARNRVNSLRVKFRLHSRDEVAAYFVTRLMTPEELAEWMQREEVGTFRRVYNGLPPETKRVLGTLGERPGISDAGLAGELGLPERVVTDQLTRAYRALGLAGTGARRHVTTMYQLCKRAQSSRPSSTSRP